MVKLIKYILLEDIKLPIIIICTLSVFIGISSYAFLSVEIGEYISILTFLFALFCLLASPVYLIWYLVNKYKKRPVEGLSMLKNVFFGVIVALSIFFTGFVHTWDKQQCNKGGRIITQALEKYRHTHQAYPDNLDQIKHLLHDLPTTYNYRYAPKNTRKTYNLYAFKKYGGLQFWSEEEGGFEYVDN